jgi:hypothetical protein
MGSNTIAIFAKFPSDLCENLVDFIGRVLAELAAMSYKA